jgi:WD40 repeat protein
LANGIFVGDGKLQKRSVPAADVDGSSEALWAKDIQGLPIFCEREALLESGNPSDAALDRIEKTVTFWRKDQRLRAATRAVSVILVLLVAASIAAALTAGQKAREAVIAAGEADRQQGISVGRQAEIDGDALRRQFKQMNDSVWPDALRHGTLLAIEASRRLEKNGIAPGEADLALRAALDNFPRSVRHFALDDPIDSAALTPDGAYLITSFKGKTTRVWNTADHALVSTLGDGAELSPDRTLAVLAEPDGALAMLELPLGKPIWTKHVDGATHLRRFSADGNYLASDVSPAKGDARRSNVVIWSARTGAELAIVNYTGSLTGMALSGTGDLLALSFERPRGHRLKASAKTILQVWARKDATYTFLAEAAVPFDGGPLSDLTFSPDATLLAANTGYHATLRDARTLKEVAAIAGPDRGPDKAIGNNIEEVAWLGFGPSGETLGTIGDDGTMQTWAVPGGSLMFSESTPGNPPGGPCAVIGKAGGARIVDIGRGRNVAWLLADKFPGYCDYAPDAQQLVLYEERDLWLYDLVSAQEDARVSNDGSANMRRRNLSPDGRYLAMADGKKVILWDVIAARALGSFEHTGELYGDIALSRDATRLATISWDGKVYLWETANRQPTWTIGSLDVIRKDEDDEEQWNVKAIYFSDAGKYLVLELGAGTYIWDVATHREIVHLPDVDGFRFTRDDEAALARHGDALQAIDMKTGKPMIDAATGEPAIPLPIENQWAFEFEPKAGLIAREQNGSIAVSALGNSHPRYLLSGLGDTMAYAFSPNGSKLAVLGHGDTKTGQVVDAMTGRQIVQLSASKDVRDFKFSSSERYLVALADASRGGIAEIIIWDLANGRKLVLPPLDQVIADIAFSPDESHVAVVGYETAKASVFNLASGKREADLSIDRQANDSRFGPDRKQLSSVEEAQLPRARFGADGKTLLQWTEDTVSVWEVGSWVETARLSHGGTVLSATSNSEKQRVATVSEDLVARQWVLPSAELIDRACRGLAGNLSSSEWRRNFGREIYSKTCENLPAPEAIAGVDTGAGAQAGADWQPGPVRPAR